MIMSIKTIMTTIAILLSPVIAVLVSIWVQDRKDKRGQKKFIFASLMSTRHHNISDEIVRSLNMIDVVFHDKKKVRKLWREYYEMLHNKGYDNPTGWEQWKTKKYELIQEMAKASGYRKMIKTIDVERVYSPVSLSEEAAKSKALIDSLLEKLKSEAITQKAQSEKNVEKKENSQ